MLRLIFEISRFTLLVVGVLTLAQIQVNGIKIQDHYSRFYERVLNGDVELPALPKVDFSFFTKTAERFEKKTKNPIKGLKLDDKEKIVNTDRDKLSKILKESAIKTD